MMVVGIWTFARSGELGTRIGMWEKGRCLRKSVRRDEGYQRRPAQ